MNWDQWFKEFVLYQRGWQNRSFPRNQFYFRLWSLRKVTWAIYARSYLYYFLYKNLKPFLIFKFWIELFYINLKLTNFIWQYFNYWWGWRKMSTWRNSFRRSKYEGSSWNLWRNGRTGTSLRLSSRRLHVAHPRSLEPPFWGQMVLRSRKTHHANDAKTNYRSPLRIILPTGRGFKGLGLLFKRQVRRMAIGR